MFEPARDLRLSVGKLVELYNETVGANAVISWSKKRMEWTVRYSQTEYVSGKDLIDTINEACDKIIQNRNVLTDKDGRRSGDPKYTMYQLTDRTQ